MLYFLSSHWLMWLLLLVVPHSFAIHFMFHICRRVVHPLEILLELIFIDLNPYCLTYITYRDSLLTDEGWMSKGRLTVFVPILTVNLNTFSVVEHRLADVDTSSCGSFEVDSDRSDSEGKYVNFFQLNDTFTILHKGFIFIFGTFTAWDYQLLFGIGDSYKLLVSFIEPSVKRKKHRKNWCLSSALFYLGYIHFSPWSNSAVVLPTWFKGGVNLS